ncbi:MAG: hypothetical protein ACRDNE_19430 [Gaiellaceae bacterium]
MRRRRVLLPFAGIACAVLLAVSGSARMSAAAFSSNLTIAGNGVTVDRLSNHFEVTPGPLASATSTRSTSTSGSCPHPRRSSGSSRSRT